jgi:hypothetical protein
MVTAMGLFTKYTNKPKTHIKQVAWMTAWNFINLSLGIGMLLSTARMPLGAVLTTAEYSR